MIAIHFIMAMIGAWRLTEVIGIDTIFEPVRNFLPKTKWLPWNCPKCVSVWGGGIATIAFVFGILPSFGFSWWLALIPYFNWPFAMSFTYLLATRLVEFWLAPKKRGVFFEVNDNGNVRIEWGGFDPKVGVERIKNVLAQMEVADRIKQGG